ncbi:chromophore lyase CpcT/CpeT [Leptolyngbya sp. FACHB-321]|uniref:CpcT/CpeT family chromophore lyase n=1 Tax=Leptolyngbya sp. FACHB-321 TaxID=2692807 RepID=UPI0016843A29|nr:chromophore lyase CpcT/CpeT [Leptolyngbya sp. FACHB-321]
MKYQSAIALVGTFCLITIVRPAFGDTAQLALEQQAEAVASRLEGVMDTSAQALVNAKAPNVRMTTCRVRLPATEAERQPNSIFLYQEQALTKNLASPYRQRFLQISPSAYSQSVRSLSFKPATLTDWINFCGKPGGDRTIQLRDLGTAVCSVFLKPSGDAYVGNTPADGCPANIRGAVRIKNHIVLQTIGMDTWDRGFDAAGKQVWGATAESYQFRRRE